MGHVVTELEPRAGGVPFAGILGKALQHVSTLWSELLPGKAALPHGGLLTALGLALGSYAEHRGERDFSRCVERI